MADDIEGLADELKQDIFSSIFCHRTGRIQDFDPITKTASIQLNDKMVIQSSGGQKPNIKSFSLLTKCPVMLPCNKDGGLQFPIKQGHPVLIAFNDKDYRRFMLNGLEQAPDMIDISHDLGFGIAIPFFPDPLGSYLYNNNAVSLVFSQGASITLDNLVEIKNQITDLKSVLNQVVDALKTVDKLVVDVTGVTYINATGAITPVAGAAFVVGSPVVSLATQLQSLIDNLLKTV